MLREADFSFGKSLMQQLENHVALLRNLNMSEQGCFSSLRSGGDDAMIKGEKGAGQVGQFLPRHALSSLPNGESAWNN